MVLVEASKLNLPQSPFSPPQILSATYDPNSRSLALTHPDSSISLHSSISHQPQLSSSAAAPHHQTLTLIPPPVSSSTFLLLQSSSTTDSTSLDADPRAVFVVASPIKAGASVGLSFYAVRKGSQVFSRVRVICKHKDCVFDEKLGAVVMKVNHGVGVRLSGDVNVFAMYGASSSRIWVFAVKMVSDGDGEVLKLMKCAVVECSVPIWSICVSYGYLILGEDNGVRVLALRPLVKGASRSKSVMRDAKYEGRLVKGKMPNGMVRAANGGFVLEGGSRKLANGHNDGKKVDANGMTLERSCNDHLEQKCNTQHASVKLRSVKVGHESGIFRSFDVLNHELSKSTKTQMTTAKAISIKAMSADKFLILDSLGNVHLLSMSRFAGLKLNLQMRQLDQLMKVQKLAVLPGTQTVWISDGFYTVRMIILADPDHADKESGENVNDGSPTVSGNRVIFTSEKIQEVVSLSANAILIIGAGSVYLNMRYPRRLHDLLYELVFGLLDKVSSWVCNLDLCLLKGPIFGGQSAGSWFVKEFMHYAHMFYPYPIWFASYAVSSAWRMLMI